MTGKVVVMATQDKHVLKFMSLMGRVGNFIKVNDKGYEDIEYSHMLAHVHTVVERCSSLLYINM